ncbi:MAG: 8-oxo-dGTP diphosphatase [Candidatus Paceibacterota bacterium]
MKVANICFLRRGDEVLLAMKKRGFGVDKWNGPGGKIQEGETIEEATVREIKEEIDVDIDKKDLQKVAEINFYFPDKEGWDMLVHVFFVESWKGEPTESEEMRPQWFPISEIPYDEMWLDDKYWLMDAIKGKKLKAKFYFKGEGKEMGKYEIKEVERF